MDLAEQYKAPLLLVRAYSDVVGAASMHGMPYVDDKAAEEAQRGLAECAAEARARGLDCETIAVSGNPADALCEVASTHGAQCVVVGSRGMHGARRVMGSVPNKVSHHACCDVLIVRTD
jgi:nucleotide-binding universal stress UspA family protein